jgi:hypothetical protein
VPNSVHMGSAPVYSTYIASPKILFLWYQISSFYLPIYYSLNKCSHFEFGQVRAIVSCKKTPAKAYLNLLKNVVLMFLCLSRASRLPLYFPIISLHVYKLPDWLFCVILTNTAGIFHYLNKRLGSPISLIILISCIRQTRSAIDLNKQDGRRLSKAEQTLHYSLACIEKWTQK